MNEADKILYAATETQDTDLKFELFQLDALLSYAINECPELIDIEQAEAYRKQINKQQEVLEEVRSAELDPTADLNVEVDEEGMLELTTEVRSFLRSEVAGDA